MEKTSSKSPDFTPYTQASKIGCGIWFMQHLKSFNIIDNTDVENVSRDIELIQINFPCLNCRKHFNEFCTKNPPRIAKDADLKALEEKRTPENLARWLVDAHNAATRHKYERYAQFHDTKFRPNDVRFEDVRTLFKSFSQEPCTEDCDKPEAFKEVPTTVVKINQKQPSFKPKEEVVNWKAKSTSEAETTPTVRIRIVPASSTQT